MFCPQCGQQQPSEEIRFCPKCGQSLLPHAALLAAGNTTAAAGPGGAQSPVRAARRVGSRRGAKLMFFSAVLLPVFIAIGLMLEGGEVMLVPPFILFLAGLTWWSYTRLFGDEVTQDTHPPSRRDLKAGGEQPALNPPQFVPASLFNQQRAHTSEIVAPPSVTEHTTTLLDRDS